MTMPLQSRAVVSAVFSAFLWRGAFPGARGGSKAAAADSAVRTAYACIFTYRFNFITARFRNEKVTRLSVVDSARLES